MRLHHLALGSPEPLRLSRFYIEALGFALVKTHTEPSGQVRSVWLRPSADAGWVLMIERTDRPPRPKVEGVNSGLFFLAFSVDALERTDLEGTLADRGVAIESRTEHTSYFRDPEGNLVGVSSYDFGAPEV